MLAKRTIIARGFVRWVLMLIEGPILCVCSISSIFNSTPTSLLITWRLHVSVSSLSPSGTQWIRKQIFLLFCTLYSIDISFFSLTFSSCKLAIADSRTLLMSSSLLIWADKLLIIFNSPTSSLPQHINADVHAGVSLQCYIQFNLFSMISITSMI